MSALVVMSNSTLTSLVYNRRRTNGKRLGAYESIGSTSVASSRCATSLCAVRHLFLGFVCVRGAKRSFCPWNEYLTGYAPWIWEMIASRGDASAFRRSTTPLMDDLGAYDILFSSDFESHCRRHEWEFRIPENVFICRNGSCNAGPSTYHTYVRR